MNAVHVSGRATFERKRSENRRRNWFPEAHPVPIRTASRLDRFLPVAHLPSLLLWSLFASVVIYEDWTQPPRTAASQSIYVRAQALDQPSPVVMTTISNERLTVGGMNSSCCGNTEVRLNRIQYINRMPSTESKMLFRCHNWIILLLPRPTDLLEIVCLA